MKKLAIIFVTAFVLSFFYYYTGRNLNTSRVQEPYNGNDFTMTIPAGSTPVKVQNKTQPVGEQQMVQNSYSFKNGGASYSLFVYEYSNRAEGTPDEVCSATASLVLNTGYSANFSNSHLGALSAGACELEGTTIKGKAAYIRTRSALSYDRKHVWMAIVVASDRRSFPTAQAEEFMDSIKINSK
jgi:hypothetical protein